MEKCLRHPRTTGLSEATKDLQLTCGICRRNRGACQVLEALVLSVEITLGMKPKHLASGSRASHGATSFFGLLAALLYLGTIHTAQAVEPRQLNALSMIESRNRDNARGRLGEVSRYQILPSTWARYTVSRNYTNPGVARTVAERIFREQERQFQAVTRRSPTNAELYLLWSCPSRFRAVHYQYHQIGRKARTNAERFAALAGR